MSVQASFLLYDGSTIEIEAQNRNSEGRVRYLYRARDAAGRVTLRAPHKDDAVYGGCYAPMNLDNALRSLLSFASAYAEAGGVEHDGVPLNASDRALAAWFSEHENVIPVEYLDGAE